MIERIDASRTKVRKFGLLFGLLGALLAAYLLFRGNTHWYLPLAASVFFAITGLAGYPVLRPLYIGWMWFAFVLGWVNTRIILGVFYYLVLTPIGLIMRLTGKDLLDRRIDRAAPTYWTKREKVPFDASRYERMF